MTEAQIKFMVDRFLAWRLPEPWHPDNGISYQRPSYHADMTPEAVRQHYPLGTNLFDAGQATEMVRHIVEGVEAVDGAPLADLSTTPVTDEMLQRAVEAFDGVFEGYLDFGANHWTDNREVAIRAALEAALAQSP